MRIAKLLVTTLSECSPLVFSGRDNFASMYQAEGISLSNFVLRNTSLLPLYPAVKALQDVHNELKPGYFLCIPDGYQQLLTVKLRGR